MKRALLALRRLDVFAVVEALLTLTALALVAITVGGQLGPLLGLHDTLGHLVGWSTALVYDALWIGALRMSEAAIRQRSRLGMAVMLTVSALALGVSTSTLLILGHARVFAFVPLAAAAFMALRLFAGHVLADPATAARIAVQDADDRNARALAAATARHLRTTAVTDVMTETAGHLGEMARQIARAETLTAAEERISKARAEAEERLQKSDKKHGVKSKAFASRTLTLAVPAPETPALLAVTGRLGTDPETAAAPALEPAADTAETQPITGTDTQVSTPADPGADTAETDPGHAVTLADLAAVSGVPTPVPGEQLTDEQLDVVLRHLRYADDPPRSYRQARDAFRDAGWRGSEDRIRPVWRDITNREAAASGGE